MDQDIEFNLVLRNFMREVRQRMESGKSYKSKDDGIRIKYVDRGTQKVVKVYDGMNVQYVHKLDEI